MKSVRNQVSYSLSDEVWNQMCTYVFPDHTWSRVLDEVRNEVSHQVGDQVWLQVRDQVHQEITK